MCYNRLHFAFETDVRDVFLIVGGLTVVPFLVLASLDMREVKVIPSSGFIFKDVPHSAFVGRQLALWTIVAHNI